MLVENIVSYMVNYAMHGAIMHTEFASNLAFFPRTMAPGGGLGSMMFAPPPQYLGGSYAPADTIAKKRVNK